MSTPITRDNLNRPEFQEDVENVRKSAQRVYETEAKGNQAASQAARTEHQSVLDAFRAKYGSLRIGHLL